MARKQLTSQSSPEDIARAQQELSSARRDYRAWFTQTQNDPNTPREVVNGIDYGPLITIPMIDQEKSRIARNYDYIEYGIVPSNAVINDPATSQLEVGISSGKDFYINGYGNISNSPALGTNYYQLDTGIDAVLDGGFRETTAVDTSVDSNVLVDTGIGAAPDDGFRGTTTADSGIVGFDEPTINQSDVQSAGDITNPNRISPAETPQSTATENESLNSPIPQQTNIDRSVTAEQNSQGLSTPSTAISSDNTESVSDISNSDDDAGTRNTTGTRPPDDGYRDVSDDDSGNNNTGGANSSTLPNGVDGANNVDIDRIDGSITDGSVSGENTAVNNNVDVKGAADPERDPGGKLIEDNIAGRLARPSPLNDYKNHTYVLSLYALTPDQWSGPLGIAKTGGVDKTHLTHLMMRSGGTAGKSVLNPQKDYHIENLVFTSIFGQNSSTTKNSNNFNLSFEIVEPYGVALLAEMVEMSTQLGIEDFKDIPYMLEIKFAGYDSQGRYQTNIPNSGPKYIPINIINITFQINSAATRYTVTATPYAHAPLLDRAMAYVPEDITVTGANFAELIESFQSQLQENANKKAEEQNRNPDQYVFQVKDSILADSKVGFEYISAGTTIDAQRRSMAGDTAAKETITVEANTTLKDAVQQIVLATDFAAKYNSTDQPNSGASKEDTLKLIKTIPTVELTDYSTAINRYVKKVTYKIEVQERYGEKGSDFPEANPERRGWLKDYDWIFTGQNDNILDFKLDYNFQFFNIYTSLQEAKAKLKGTPSVAVNPLPDDGLSTNDQPGQAQQETSSQPLSDTGAKNVRSPAHLRGADVMDNVLNNPGADQIRLDMTIVGDPDWIPQDKSILPAEYSASTKGHWDSHNSIAIDSGDVLVMVRFKTPRDYDPVSGLMNIETSRTYVQGLYRVIQSENRFSDGKFQCVLTMLRVPNQISNDSSKQPKLIDFYQSSAGPGQTALGGTAITGYSPESGTVGSSNVTVSSNTQTDSDD